MNAPVSVIAVACPFTWWGMVIGISAIETPLKFRAPGVTLEIGLGIGRAVFRALNRAELVLAIVLAIAGGVLGRRVPLSAWALGAVLLTLLLVQMRLLRPALERRTAQILGGDASGASSLHRWYVAAEGLKMLGLPALGTVLALTMAGGSL